MRAVLPYFRIHGLLANAGVCLSTDPRHVIYFCVMPDGSARISNELIAIDPEAATSISRAIFSESPRVDRVVWTHIKGDLGRAALPHLVHEVIKDWTIDLPSKVEDCRSVIGRTTYKNLRRKQRLLYRTFADAEFRIIEKDEIDAHLVHELVEMNRRRLSRKGTVSGYDSDPQREPRLVATLRECGFGGLLYADGKLIGGVLCSTVDTACFQDLVGLDQDYGRFSPGLMCSWLVMEECVRRGALSFHLLWGTDWFKQRLGAHADDLWTVTLYRSRGAQLRHWRETAAAGATKVRRAARKARYFARGHARRLAKRGLMALGWRQAEAASDVAGVSVATEAMPGPTTQALEASGDTVARLGDREDAPRSGDVD